MKLKPIILQDLADKLAPAKVEQTNDVIVIEGYGYTFVFNHAGELLNVVCNNKVDWDVIYRILVRTYTTVNQSCNLNLSMEVTRNDK